MRCLLFTASLYIYIKVKDLREQHTPITIGGFFKFSYEYETLEYRYRAF